MVAQSPRTLSDKHKRLLYGCAFRLLRSERFGNMAKNVEPDDLVNHAWLRNVRYRGGEWLNPKHITVEMIQYILSDFSGRSIAAYMSRAKKRPRGRMVTPNSAQAYLIAENLSMFCEVKTNDLAADMVSEIVAILPSRYKWIFEQVYGYGKSVCLVGREQGVSEDVYYDELKTAKKIIERELGFVIR